MIGMSSFSASLRISQNLLRYSERSILNIPDDFFVYRHSKFYFSNFLFILVWKMQMNHYWRYEVNDFINISWCVLLGLTIVYFIAFEKGSTGFEALCNESL